MPTTFNTCINWQDLSISDLPLASIVNIKKNAEYSVDFIFDIIQVSRARGGVYIALLTGI